MNVLGRGVSGRGAFSGSTQRFSNVRSTANEVEPAGNRDHILRNICPPPNKIHRCTTLTTGTYLDIIDEGRAPVQKRGPHAGHLLAARGDAGRHCHCCAADCDAAGHGHFQHRASVAVGYLHLPTTVTHALYHATHDARPLRRNTFSTACFLPGTRSALRRTLLAAPAARRRTASYDSAAGGSERPPSLASSSGRRRT